jgi:hypothetical protein
LTTWSYGAGVSHGLIGPLGFDAEARFRHPLERQQALPPGFSRDWEYRVGLSIGFGGGSHHSSRRYSDRRERPRTVVSSGSVRPERRPERYPERYPERRPLPPPERGARTLARVLDDADRYVGTRYAYGGTSPERGFDCSGFVQYVFAQQGLGLPRTSRQMARVGLSVDGWSDERFEALRAGDLLFFANDGSRIDHVAIYAGRGRIIHSTASGGGVRYDDLESERGRWFAERMVAVRRVVADGRVLLAPFAEPGVSGDDELDPPDRAPRPRAERIELR